MVGGRYDSPATRGLFIQPLLLVVDVVVLVVVVIVMASLRDCWPAP
jgi:hypothetical protein